MSNPQTTAANRADRREGAASYFPVKLPTACIPRQLASAGCMRLQHPLHALRCASAVLVLALACTNVRAASEPPGFSPATLERVLERNDPLWTTAPDRWFDGAPLGNGDLGVVAWCGGNRLILTLDKTDLVEARNFQPDPAKYTWANYRRILAEKYAAGRATQTEEELRDFQRPRRAPMGTLPSDAFEPPYVTRLPLGRLEFRFSGTLQDFSMRLHLSRATLEGRIVTSDGTMEWSAYVHALRPLVIVSWRTTGSLAAEPRVRLAVDDDSFAPQVRDQLRSWDYAAPVRTTADGIDSTTEAMPAGGEYDVSTRRIDAAGERALALTISCSPDSRSAQERSRKELAHVPDRALLRASHDDWWRRYYPASFLTVPDTRLEALYWLEMYRLGAGTRPDRLPLALEGPWTVDGVMPRFAGSYYWNVDTEETYWPIYTANRLEFGESLYRMVDEMRPALREFTRKFFGIDGEFLRIGTDSHGNSTYMSPTVVVEFNGLPWVCHLYWLHYRYSMDRDFLRRRAVPLMKAALAPYLSELREGRDGFLHLEFSESPEYAPPGHPRWGPDATIDLSLIRGLCTWLIQADDDLASHDPDRGRWESVLTHLAPYPRDSSGGLAVRADQELVSSHRHHSHLMPIYPLRLIDLQSDPELVEKSIERWKFQGTGEWTGWSYGWGASIAAWTGQPELARTLLLDYVDHFVSSSGFHMDGVRNNSFMTIWKEHNVLTLEAGFGAANALQDMLLQSHRGVVRIFPATPWGSAAFWSLRAEGAFLVTARRDAGRLEFCEITSLRGGQCRVLLPDDGEGLRFSSGGRGKKVERNGREIRFDTDPGETVVMALPDVSREIVALEPRVEELHFFGKKRPVGGKWDSTR